ncbi:MAG: DivIVA domain-containing protein [Eubacterium sp.]|nr:DivIVA domain-containing protein [Oscillospiraceae bacterium]MDD6355818.1 DivIVA domain-containing protein [Oscillospiraceae bacterium]MDY4608389.1 DivIVA domain-containing protein [Eubacterium sp.]
MSESSVINRESILGGNDSTHSFDKVLRGYDPKQVDSYIAQLELNSKKAGELFDARTKDLVNDKEMLTVELSRAKEQTEKVQKLFESCQEERDRLASKLREKPEKIVEVDTAMVVEYEERIKSLTTKLRLKTEENKKLEQKNADLQRDVAHLTKKVDKNRTKINDLTNQVEGGIEDSNQKNYTEIINIYESAIDKAEDLIYRLQTELSLAHSKAEDAAEN